MDDRYAEIKAELELTREELLRRLEHSTLLEFGEELIIESNHSKKERFILHHIKEDLQDVERALTKMTYGSYGVCEESGKPIPFEKLRVLPTARTIHDFTFSDLFEKRVFPQIEHPTKVLHVSSS